MPLHNRPYYIDRLWKWRDKEPVKVVTGVRRSGKSAILELYREKLLLSGVSAKQIVAFNFEDPNLPEFTNWHEVWELIKPRLNKNKVIYIFLDEVQRVPEFEKLIDGLQTLKNTDVYITGSNAYMLSGELATLISGRYVEIAMQPLSFKEYCDIKKIHGDYARHYVDYLRQSSFPYTLSLDADMTLISDYLDGIYNTILVKDVLKRKQRSDATLVDRTARFLFDNIGNITSIRNVANVLTSNGVKTNGNTVDGYVDALCDAFLFRKAQRYDIRGKEVLASGCKYYAADMGLRYRITGNRAGDTGRILENIIYLELIRRSRNVMVGQHDGKEIDFVTNDGGDLHYYQVAETVRDDATREREYGALRSIHDHHPKTLITLDDDLPMNTDGIRQINAFQFLIGE